MPKEKDEHPLLVNLLKLRVHLMSLQHLFFRPNAPMVEIIMLIKSNFAF